jgi:hypothetical protein
VLPSTSPLQPGSLVSMDHYESSVRGRLYEGFGKERAEHRFCGGTIFYNHCSKVIFPHHQVSLGSSDTIRSKNSFELEALRCGVDIKRYHSDNGHFTSAAFEQSLRTEQNPQQHTLLGVGAKHQKPSERAIQTVTWMARALMLRLQSYLVAHGHGSRSLGVQSPAGSRDWRCTDGSVHWH